MNDFTFLTEEQCFGVEKLDIFEKRGIKAAITDFSILLGGWYANTRHIDRDNSLEGRTGWYWTKSAQKESYAIAVSDSCGGMKSMRRGLQTLWRSSPSFTILINL